VGVFGPIAAAEYASIVIAITPVLIPSPPAPFAPVAIAVIVAVGIDLSM
jgi:hypothetical protein